MELQQACRGFLRQVSLVLDQTNRADEAGLVLSLLLDVLEGFCKQQEPDNQTNPHNPRVNFVEVDGAQLRSKPHLRPLATCLDALQAAQHGASNVWAMVCWHCMDSLVEIRLQAAEASWWEGLSSELQGRMKGMLEKAPAPMLLYSLSGYLGMLARAPPSGSRVSRDQSAVSMLGSHTAASLLQQLFTDDNSHGVAELVLYSAAMTRVPQDPTTTAPLDGTQQTPGPRTSHQPTGALMQNGQRAGVEPQQQPILLLPPDWREQHHQQPSLGVPAAYKPIVGVTGLAGLLAALPDRLASYMPRHGAMRHEDMYTRMMAQLLQLAARPCDLVNQHQQPQPQQQQQHHQQPQQEQLQQEQAPWEQTQQEQQQRQGQQQQGDQPCHYAPSSTAAVADVPPGAVAACAAALCAQLMARLCTRGYTQLVARALLSAQQACLPVASACPGWPAPPTQLLQQAILPAITANLLHQPPITSRLLQALLAASAQASPAYQTTSAYPAAPVRRTPACTAPAEAHRLLQLLGGHQALAAHPEMRYVLSEQLPAHHTLPTPAIHLLLDVLEAASRETQTPTAPGSAIKGASTPAEAAWWTAALMQQGLDGGGLPDLDSTMQLPGSRDAAHEAEAEGIELGQVAAGLAAVWGDAAPLGSSKSNHSTGNRKSEWSSGVGPEAQAATARAGASLARQGYLSCVLVLLLARLSKPQVERVPGLLGGLLSGVSVRLASPLPAVRRQGMRVGRALSVVLEAPSPLFDDQGSLDLLPDELWPGALPPSPDPSAPAAHPPSATTPPQPTSRTSVTPGVGLSKPGTASQGPGSPSESDDMSGEGVEEVDSDDDSSLEEYDLHEDPAAEAWAKLDPKSMQLRAVCAALRKSDDVTGVLDTLKRVELLVRARPDELEACAHDLARALLHCRVPEWAQPDEGTRLEEAPSALRGLSLSALASVCPLPAGDVLLLEVFSPHLDTFQRLLIMQTLATAAQELSDPSRAPRLECPPGQAPRLVHGPLPATRQRTTSLPGASAPAPALTSPATQAAGMSRGRLGQQAGGQALAGRASDSGAAAGTLAAGKTRVWGHVALNRQRRGAALTHRNTFADVALRWTHGLLREVDRVKHGVDLLGRDTMVLCSVLHTLGVFAECASASPAAQPVCVAVLELLAAPQVHGHAEAAVRRAVLLSAGQVLAALPAPGVAAAISGAQTSDTALVKRLQWLQTWLEAASQDDGDDRCRAMATACLQLHAALSGEAAFQALEMGHSAWPELGPAGAGAKGLGGLTGSVMEPKGFQGAGSMVTGPMGLMRQGVVLLPHHAQVHL